MLSIKIKDIHQCEDTDHVVRTRPEADRVDDLVPAGTMLVTPDLTVPGILSLL